MRQRLKSLLQQRRRLTQVAAGWRLLGGMAALLLLDTISLASPPHCCCYRCLPGVQGDYVMPAGALGFEHLDVKPHKVGGRGVEQL